MLNPSFAAAAAVAFNETPARGPYTLAMGNSAIWIPLPNITANYSVIIDQIRNQAATDDVASLRLPPAYGSDPALIAGYRAQLLAIADLLANPRSPSLESAFSTGTGVAAALLHPLSRGTARLNVSDPLGLPVLDYRSASNPVDMSLHLAHLRYLARMVRSPTLRGLGAALVGLPPPRADADGGSDEDSEGVLAAYVRSATVQSFMHPCCTAAMMPPARGGVVGTDLRVHGASGLRVVDASVFPVLPAAHLSATAYAVAEKVSFGCMLLTFLGWIVRRGECADWESWGQAADIMIRDWMGRTGER